jgi:hypothetical protein
MGERDGSRPLTQRKFEDLTESGPPPFEEPPPKVPDTEGPATTPSPPASREPSDLELRARQMKWLRERERVG